MARFDRYLLSQLVVLFGFFSLVLVLVYWINQAVSLFDTLVANGQSATVFLEFSALSLPSVIRVVLPISAFVATIYVTNRLTNESELVVVQATGYSPFRLARPVLVFGILVALLMSMLNHILVPASTRELTKRSAEMADNISARFLVEGNFLHPASGITFYIREITPEGELKDIFLSDARASGSETTYTAKSALLMRDAGGPKLVMFRGMAQTLQAETQNLITTRFEDFVFDIGGLISAGDSPRRRPREMYTPELLRTTAEMAAESGTTRARLLFEANERVSLALLAVVSVLIGFSSLLLGSFSRFGLWRQIVLAVVLLIVIKSLDNAAADIARNNTAFWPVVYLPILAGLGLSGLLLWIASRPAIMQRKSPSP